MSTAPHAHAPSYGTPSHSTSSDGTPSHDNPVSGNPVSDEPYERARRRVIAKSVYQGMLGLWTLLALAQIAIWYLTTPNGHFWPVWPIMGTLIAAVAWGLPLYAPRPAVSERRIQAEMARMRRDA